VVKVRLSVSLLGLFLTTTLAVCALCALAPQARADQAEEGLLPICAPVTSADPAWNLNESHWQSYISENTSVGIADQYVGMGLANDCAYQSYVTSELICEGQNCHRSDILEYHPFVPGHAFPDTFDAADGDHQRVTITMPGTAPEPNTSSPGVAWGACFPGFKWHEPMVLTGCDPNGWQYNPDENTSIPGTTDSFPAQGGAMIYRPFSPGGIFTGPWTASFGDASPGFHLQHLGAPCTTTDTSCEYELDFTRDPTGQLQVTQDMQVVLQLPATKIGAEGPIYATVAIPMMVIQTGGNGSPGGGSGSGPGGSGGGSGAGPGGSGGGAGGGGATALVTKPAVTCTVPKVAKLTPAKAKSALAAAHCKAGGADHAWSAAVKKGLVIAADPPTGSKVATTKPVDLTISRGRKPKKAAHR
jgi:uncharacterized membrane protein YgcG